MREFITHSESETKEVAQEIAASLAQGAIIGLVGDLGSGKTAFAQGFLSYFGVQRVKSPTFGIFNMYSVNHQDISRVYHFDVYRVHDIDALRELGIDEIFSDDASHVLIEWADKIKTILPPKTILINFELIGKNVRRISVSI